MRRLFGKGQSKGGPFKRKAADAPSVPPPANPKPPYELPGDSNSKTPCELPGDSNSKTTCELPGDSGFLTSASSNLSISSTVPSSLPDTLGVAPITERVPTPRIIVGIDYGTTYSGISYIYIPTDVSFTPCQLSNHIHDISNWPGPKNYTSHKVPSEIAYGANGEIHWGGQISPAIRLRYRWMKLLLEPDLREHSYDVSKVTELRRARNLLKENEKTEVQVTSDYLSALWTCASGKIEQALGKAVFSIAKRTVVITVPAVWSEKAKENTFKAALNAKIASSETELRLISEPEAAAFSILYRSNSFLIQPGHNFIVCDGGGGTVDLTTYEVISSSPLSVKEITHGTGGPYGSVFINLAFSSYLRNVIIGPEKFDKIAATRPDKVTRWLRDFEWDVKRAFEDSCQEGPYMCDLGSEFVEDNAENGTKDGILTLSNELIKSLFGHVMCSIEDLLRKQVLETRKLGGTIKVIHLVGGFAESKYLQKRLQSTFENAIEIQVPDAASSAISGGAIYSVLLGNTISLRIARANYGIMGSNEYDPLVHISVGDKAAKFWDSSFNCWKVAGRMMWFLRKGQEVQNKETKDFAINKVLTADMVRSRQSLSLTFQLYINTDDEPPERGDTGQVHLLCKILIKIDLQVIGSKFSNIEERTNEKGKFWVLPLALEVSLGEPQLHFRCIDKNRKVVGCAIADYTVSSCET